MTANTPESTTPETFPQLEARVHARWVAEDVFARSLAARADAQPWVFYEGPPTANGRPGVHHLLARTFKDVFARHRTMTGRKVPRKAGWDCHGLPVELEVERELGFHSKDEVESYGLAAFNARCRASALSYLEEWDELTSRLGFWLDREHAYRTMDDDYMESVWWALAQVWKRGLLYHALRVVPHCPRCQVSLSSHEVALGYKDVTHESAYVSFPLVGEEASLLAWTSVPWTLAANRLLAVDPAATYLRVREHGRVFVLAADRRGAVLGAGAAVLDSFPGSDLLGRRYQPPFRALPDEAGAYEVVAGAFVDVSEGTGVVHLAPAHGVDDFELAAAHGVPALTVVGADGCYDERMGVFAGAEVVGAQPALLADLKTRGLLHSTRALTHSYPHCWRCQTELTYLAKPAWYARTTAVSERMRELNRAVSWHPPSAGSGRFDEWLAGNVDWALSRERYWGTPLPLWTCPGNHVHCVSSRAELAELTGAAVSGLHREDVDALHFPCPQCGLKMTRTPEVLDVWFDSGAMPFAQHHYPFAGANEYGEAQVADFVCEGLDQTRGWFYSLLAVSTLVFDRLPYRNVLCLGLVAAADGTKMAKSRGNAADPWALFERYGADACRWYYLTAKAPWEGYSFCEADVGAAASRLNTMLHAARFYETYDQASGQRRHALAETELHVLDRWLLSRLDEVTLTASAALADYDATAAARAVDAFMEELSNWYLRLSRRRFWDGEVAALATLQHVLGVLARLLAPLTPFLAEELYALSGAKESVHLADYPQPAAYRDLQAEEAMSLVRELVRLGHAVRAHAKLPLRQPLALATLLLADPGERADADALADLLAAELNVKRVVVAAASPEVCDVQVQPDFARLGPRLSRAVEELAVQLQAADGVAFAQELTRQGHVTLQVGARAVTLDREDVRLLSTPRPGYGMVVEGERAVALTLDRDPELVREGLAREVARAVQAARRQADLAVSDRVRVHLAGDEPLLEAARAHAKLLMKETLALELTFGELTGAGEPCGGYRLAVDVQLASSR